MKIAWPQHLILHTASLLAPFDQRAEWLDGWRSELWYVPRRGATRFCLGAFPDALWLRRNNLSPVKRTGLHLESPIACLAFLATLAAVSSVLAISLPGPQLGPGPTHVRPRDLLDGFFGMFMISALALPAIRVAMGPSANRCPMPWQSRLRRGAFLAAKIALVLPIMFGAFVVTCSVPLTNLGFNASWILAFRWLLLDQRRRCPVCLRLLTDPVRIGSASQTFLEWYGAESMCSRGHGLLHAAEMPASHSARPQWIRLGDSWKGLFSESGADFSPPGA